MFLRIEQDGFGGRWGNRPKHVDVLQCDHCGREYRFKHRIVNQVPPTFCSRSCLAQSPMMLERKRQTCLRTYGVEYVSQAPSVKHSKHLTRKQNRTYGRSNAEDEFFDWLTARYGVEEVECWPQVNGWSIDFYVRPVMTCVQFDGVYWHGLTHPYECLTEGQRKVYDKDRAQDQWFEARGMRLVRVTDIELAACRSSGDWSDIAMRFGR